MRSWLRSLTTIDGGTAAAGRLAPWTAGCSASRLPCLRRGEGLGLRLGARVRGVSEALRVVRLDCRFDAGNWGSEVDKWCRGAGLGDWRTAGAAVGGGPVLGGLALSAHKVRTSLARRLSAAAHSAQRSAVYRYFGSVRCRNQSRSRTPNCTGLETETEPKNRTTDFSVRFRFGSVRFGVRFSVKKHPG